MLELRTAFSHAPTGLENVAEAKHEPIESIVTLAGATQSLSQVPFEALHPWLCEGPSEHRFAFVVVVSTLLLFLGHSRPWRAKNPYAGE